MTTKLKIPKIRFKEFSSEWEEKKLGEISNDIKSGKTQNNNFGFYNLYGSTGIIGKCENYSNDGNYILVARVGANAGTLNLVNGKFGVTDNTLIIDLDNKTNIEFIYNFLKIYNLNKLVFGSGQPLITGTQLKNLKLNLPLLPEQQKISQFLSSVDEKIEKIKEKKKNLEDYKKGIIQKIFSQEIRFKDENGEEFGEWEEKSLGEIGETYSGLNGKSGEDFGSGKPFITYKQIFDNSKIDISKFALVSINSGEKQNKVKYGDIFFTVSSETPQEVGMSAVLLDEIKEDLYLNSFCFGFRLNSFDMLSPEFTRFYFRYQDVRKKIIILAQGSTRYNISKNEMMKIKINLPILKEQEKIADFLSGIDEKIEKVSDELEKVKEFKKGLLQVMFV